MALSGCQGRPNGETIPRERTGNLPVLLDAIDSMTDDMLCDLHDGCSEVRDDLYPLPGWL